MGKITLVTGTDTGVGKTLLTACLCHHLRKNGVHALAAKPFCTGSRSDARVLRGAAGNELTLEEVNPFYFKEPIAPYVAAKRPVTLERCLEAIHESSNHCEHLLVEGAGGVLTPLGRTFFITDLPGETILVSQNRLGTINHTLLSAKAHKPVAVALMNQKRSDLSSRTNAEAIRELLTDVPVVEIPYLGSNAKGRIREIAAKIAPLLDSLLGKKNPAVMPCGNSSFELRETGGTGSIAFDFQLRPVGGHSSLRLRICQLRFKDFASQARAWAG